MLIEDSEILAEALPVEDFKAHLRLGRGFAGDTVQDEVLESFLRAAISAIEGRTGKSALTRDFTWSFPQWRDDMRQTFPIAPVQAVIELAMQDGDGAATVVDAARYRLERDPHFPALCARGGSLPWPPADGSVRVRFSAGYGPDWEDVPADLAQAVMLLAAHYYEHREATELGQGCMPFGVTSLIERYRPMRLLHGGRA